MKRRKLAAILLATCLVVSNAGFVSLAVESEGDNPVSGQISDEVDGNHSEDEPEKEDEELKDKTTPGETENGGADTDTSKTKDSAEQKQNGTTGKEENSVKEKARLVQPKAAEKNTLEQVYVSADGDDENGAGTKESPVATLAKAVEVAKDNATIYVMSNLTMTETARFWDKNLTIKSDGGLYTVSRGEIKPVQDPARGGYNPAMIEVGGGSGSQSSSLILENLILDDGGKRVGNHFVQADSEGDGSTTIGGVEVGNMEIVQDAIIATYNRTSTITLGEGTTLKNFGGMSAVRLSGGELTMKSGSKIVDESITDRTKEKNDNGPAGAVWMQGGTFVMEEGSVIDGVVGRAIYVDGGNAKVNGTISNIKGDPDMWWGYEGVAIHVRNSGEAVLGASGKINGITGEHDTGRAAIRTNPSSKFTADKGSLISNVTGFSTLYSNYGTDLLNGTIENCSNDYIIGGFAQDTTIGESGVIQNCTARGVAGAIVYTSNSSKVYMKGTIKDNTCSHAFYIINQSGGGAYLEMYDGAVVTGKGTGDGVYVNASESQFVMKGGEISGFNYGVNCRGKVNDGKPRTGKFTMENGTITANTYGVYFQCTAGSQSLMDINGGVIEGNKTAEIYISNGNSENTYERTEIKAGVVKGMRNVKLPAGTLTLDEDYADVGLGKAKVAAVNKIEELVKAEHEDWTMPGSNGLWIRPTKETYHYQITRPSNAKKTGLFMAYIPLKEDGTPVDGAELTLKEVENENPVDVTMTGLKAGTAYAVMFVNNAEYTLSPDDTTIYTGGGQGEETSDDGFPKLSFANCLDEVKKLEVDGQEITGTDEELTERLMEYVTVAYTTQDGKQVENDIEAGEYVACLSWKTRAIPEIRVNGNEVNEELETGTLLVRHTENQDGAIDGTITYPVVSEAPTEEVEHSVAVPGKKYAWLDPAYYTNDDEEREVTDTDGISLLDDDLLNDGTDRQPLMEKKAEEILESASDGMGYKFDFHYLDLVDAHNGNAWVSSEGGSTIYLPYPEGTSADTEFTLVHYKDLHREYGISGREEVEEAVANCELEEMAIEKTDVGIKFTVDRSGFSPFALAWQVVQKTVTVNYLDVDTDDVIADPYVEKVAVGDSYDVSEQAKKELKGWKWVRTDGAVTGDGIAEDVVVNAYYEKSVVSEDENEPGQTGDTDKKEPSDDSGKKGQTSKGKTEGKGTPETGDSSPVVPFAATAGISLVLIAGCLVMRRVRR